MRDGRVLDKGRTGGLARWARGALLAVWGCVAAVSGCAPAQDPEVAAEPIAPTRLRVENQAFLDMTIYVYRGSQRYRLGQATGSSVTRFTIPNNLIFGSTQLRFQADPIGGNRSPMSQEITVVAGDEVTLTIPPQ